MKTENIMQNPSLLPNTRNRLLIALGKFRNELQPVLNP